MISKPNLAALPPPPPGKTGWPWTAQSNKLFDSTQDQARWPKVTIVTPSYNQGQFIEETIRSVLLQNYPNLEYIIIDGGSTDNSVEIIRKYEPWLAYWVSEPDRGIYDAINKGIAMATGKIIGIINSDDWYENDAVETIIKNYDERVDVYHGFLRNIREEREKQIVMTNPNELQYGIMIEHPTCFVRKLTYEKIGQFSLEYKLAGDLDFMLRAYKANATFKQIPNVIANFRMEGKSNINYDVAIESLKIQRKYKIISRNKYIRSTITIAINRVKRILFRGK